MVTPDTLPPVDEADPPKIERVLDVPVSLAVEIGGLKTTVERVLALGPNSLMLLDARTDEPLRLLVNGRLIGAAAAVTIGDNWGVRVTSMITPEARLSALR